MILRHLLFWFAVLGMVLMALRFADTGTWWHAVGVLINAAWAGAEQWAIVNKIPFPRGDDT